MTGLFDDYVPEITNPKLVVTKRVKRHKGTISIRLNNNPTLPFAVDFDGFQEGSGSPCKDEEEVQAVVQRLKEEKNNYDLKVVDERSPHIKYSYLNEYRAYIERLCKEAGQEPEIWFDSSTPYDCEIALRMKGHKCYYECINFRFEKGILKAWDNGFQSPMGSGTNMLHTDYGSHQSHVDRINIIRELMERVLKNECCINCNETKPRLHEVDEHGWLIRDGVHNLLNKDD
jgi:hypothetical protein